MAICNFGELARTTKLQSPIKQLLLAKLDFQADVLRIMTTGWFPSRSSYSPIHLCPTLEFAAALDDRGHDVIPSYQFFFDPRRSPAFATEVVNAARSIR